MPLTLRIENEAGLADGGPVTYTVAAKRGFDIGRDSHLDWTLPDPSRYISSKHCEVRYRDNAYWLVDVSTNGTFLNGADRRMSEPHRLRDGDRIAIGHYIIQVSLTGEVEQPEAAAQPAHNARPVPQSVPTPAAPLPVERPDMWGGDVVQPAPRAVQNFQQPEYRAAPVVDRDALDWMADLPPMEPTARPRPARAAREFDPQDDWSVAEDPTSPRPTRPRRASADDDGGWWSEPSKEVRPAPPVEPVAARQAPPGPPRAAAAPAAKKPVAEPIAEAVVERPPAKAQPAVPQPAVAPPLAPAPAIAPASVTAPARAGGDDAMFLRAFAQTAGLDPRDLDHRSPEELGQLLGSLVRITVDELRQLLEARFEAKRMVRSSNQTQISGNDNNPMKFTPTTDDALKLMLGPAKRGYLDATRAVKSSFADIKTHQLETFAAMQAAVMALTEDFEPGKIEAAAGQDSAIGNLLGSRKARAWDVFVARWDAKTLRADNGILGAFMEHFAKCYDSEK